jgi:uncharacterized protein with von Willebrand factor type A (vWA) domain
MNEQMIRFISALRAGVRVSLAESADAFLAVKMLGVQERESFRFSLRATLVKEASSLPAFDALFPLFSTAASSPCRTPHKICLPKKRKCWRSRCVSLAIQLRQLLEKLLRGEATQPAGARPAGADEPDSIAPGSCRIETGTPNACSARWISQKCSRQRAGSCSCSPKWA